MERIYAILLSLYPKTYSEKDKEQLLALCDDAYTEAKNKKIVWVSVLKDLCIQLVKEYIEVIGIYLDTLRKENPLVFVVYILSICCLLPATTLAVGGTFMQYILQSKFSLAHLFAGTFLAHMNILRTIFITLPICALVLIIVSTFLLDTVAYRKQLFSWNYLERRIPSFFILVLGGGVLSIFFMHDTFGCISGGVIHLHAVTWINHCIATH